MRTGALPQPPMAEHTPGPGSDRDQIERVELAGVHGGRQDKLQDDLLGGLRHACLSEAALLIEAPRPGIIWCHQQPDAPAARNPAQMPPDGL